MTQRYEGQDLGNRPRIAVLGSSKLGNYIATTPLLRGLKERFADCVLDFYGSPVSRAFEERCPWIDWRTDIFPLTADRLQRVAEDARRRTSDRAYALAINCDGFNPYTTALTTLLAPDYAAGNALSRDLGETLPLGEHPYNRILADTDWTTSAFRQRHAAHLTSNYIGELFARMAFVDTDFFAIELHSEAPDFDVPDVLIHANATRDAKLWPTRYWIPVLDWCRDQGLEVGLVGVLPAPGEEDRAGYPIESVLASHPAVVDLRGRTTPVQLAGALSAARVLVTVDSGPLHVAAAVGCPTVAIFGNTRDGIGASPLWLWLPRVGHISRTTTDGHCTLCLDNRFRNSACLRSEHRCMTGVRPEAVIALLRSALADQEGALPAAAGQ